MYTLKVPHLYCKYIHIPPQLRYGLPTLGSGQKQAGSLFGSQRAPRPQGLGSHGLRLFTQPLMVLGLSRKPGRQVHLANPLLKMAHWVLGPQGDGSQGLVGRAHGRLGGLPSNSGRQKQSGTPFTRRQPEFGPHWLGSHFSPSGTEIKYVKISNKKTYNSYINVHLVYICTFQVDKLYCS